jgi:hypothetical protein
VTLPTRMLLPIILLALLPVTAAHAELPDSVGIITDDLNEKGELTLDIHANSTPHGANLEPSYPGEVLANHGIRLTPSLSFGLQDNLELSVSAPIVRDNMGNSGTRLAGLRGRITWIASDIGNSHGYWGASASLLSTRQDFEYGKTLWDVGLIGGYRTRSWHVATNAFLSNGLANGLQHMAPDYSLNTRLANRVSKNTWLGVELYSSRSKSMTLDGIQWFTTNTLFATAEIQGKKNNFQFGVGRGLNGNTDPWTLRLSVDIPL